jgi:hypothetical protein
LRELPPGRRQGRQGRTATRRRRQPRDRSHPRRHPRSERQRRPGVSRLVDYAKKRSAAVRAGIAGGG